MNKLFLGLSAVALALAWAPRTAAAQETTALVYVPAQLDFNIDGKVLLVLGDGVATKRCGIPGRLQMVRVFDPVANEFMTRVLQVFVETGSDGPLAPATLGHLEAAGPDGTCSDGPITFEKRQFTTASK